MSMQAVRICTLQRGFSAASHCASRALASTYSATLAPEVASMIIQELATIVNHPEVCLHFPSDTARYAFAKFYVSEQEQAEELLSLLAMIEQYRTMPYEVAG